MPNIADDEACQIDSKGNNTATINCEKQYQNRHKIILEKHRKYGTRKQNEVETRFIEQIM